MALYSSQYVDVDSQSLLSTKPYGRELEISILRSLNPARIQNHEDGLLFMLLLITYSSNASATS